MDGADDDYCGPPGRLPYSDSGSSQRHRLASYPAAYNGSASGSAQAPSRRDPRLHGIHQIAASLDPQEIESFMRGQFIQHELQMRRRFLREQHEQLFSHLLHPSNNPSNASTGGSPLMRSQQQASQQNPTSPGGSVQIPSNHHYAGADFALNSTTGRRILQEEQAFLRVQQQELLRIRMMRTQVNSNNPNNSKPNSSAVDQQNRFLELTSQMHHGNRQRSASGSSLGNEKNSKINKVRKRSNSAAIHNTNASEMKKRKRTESTAVDLSSNDGKRVTSQESSKRKKSFSDTKEAKKISKTIEITEILDDDDDDINVGKKNNTPQSIEVINLEEGTEEEDSISNSDEKEGSKPRIKVDHRISGKVQNPQNKEDDQKKNETKRDELRKDDSKSETKKDKSEKGYSQNDENVERAKESTQVTSTGPNEEIEFKKKSKKEENNENGVEKNHPNNCHISESIKTVPEEDLSKKVSNEEDNIISKEEFEGNVVNSIVFSSPPKRDISLLLLASEEIDLKAMDYELTLTDEKSSPPAIVPKIDGIKLLDAASKSIEESSFNDSIKEHDVEEKGILVADTVDDDSNRAPTVMNTPEKLIPASNQKKNDSQADETDSIQYIKKPMCPGFDFKLPTLPCEAEYDETIIKKMKNKSKNKKDGSRLTLSSKSQHRETNKNSGIKTASQMVSTLDDEEDTNVKDPMEISVNKEKTKKTIVYKAPVDTWWPSNNTIRRERRLQGYRSDEDEDEEKSVKIASLPSLAPSMHERLSNHIEPGILEKLPHCKIHQARVEQQKHHPNPGPLFCSQVTEAYCTEVMLCCSICHTWRHAACGGHYTKYKPHTSKDEINSFKPICDRCHAEKKILEAFPQAPVRIKKQRVENLRRALSTTSVVRHFSFAKHGGTYKWPLGSVSATHIGGHTRSVHARHERSEKQWSELAMKLGNGLGYRPKERVKVRTRELERLIVSIEDAEGETDRHNMMLFLQNDVAKENPVGFKKSCCSRNFFDPAEDVYDVGEEKWRLLSKEKLVNKNIKVNNSSKFNDVLEGNLNKVDDDKTTNDDDGKSIGSLTASCDSDNSDMSDSKIDNDNDDESSMKSLCCDDSCTPSLEEDEDLVSEQPTILEKQSINESQKNSTENSKKHVCKDVLDSKPSYWHEGECIKIECARHGCKRTPRFDSIFCSDSCGVSALELDLLRSFEYASDIHPSLLRA